MASILVLLLFVLAVESCGITTHTVIGKRAFYWWKKEANNTYPVIINNHLKTFYAGLIFPDWGYNCIIGDPHLKNASEMAHWLPFQQATIQYLHQTYHLNDENAERLIAFLFGVMSHSVADIIWHDLGVIQETRQGFIQALANTDYQFQGRDYNSTIHSLADIGGEFMAGLEFDLSYLGIFDLPYHDIVKIYQSLGINVSKLDLEVCIYELYMELEIMKVMVDEIIYYPLASQSPFLIDYYQDWWLGGIWSLATWTQNCWDSLAIMVEEPNYPPCYIYSKSVTNLPTPPIASNYQGTSLKESHYCSQPKHYTVYRLNESYSFLGYDVVTCDLNGDGNQEVIFGAPGSNNGRGAVYIVPFPKQDGEIYLTTNCSTMIAYHGARNSRFGIALSCLDLNLDGFDDLVIGVPGDDTLSNKGQVQVFFGRKDLALELSIVITSTIPGSNLGLKIRSQKSILFLENYLANVVNNLNQGQIIYIPASHSIVADHVTCDQWQCDRSWLKVISLPSSFWTWGGFQVLFWSSYFVISEPLYLGCGRVYAYDGEQIIWQISSPYSNSRFGFDMIVDANDNLIVSSPHNSNETGKGAIYTIPLKDLGPKNYTIDDFPIIAHASSYYTNLGWSLATNGQVIFLGEPRYAVGQGAFYLLTNTSRKCYTFSQPGSLLGRKLLASDKSLFVAGPWESVPQEQAGAVYFIPAI